jgi:hypothetical protein
LALEGGWGGHGTRLCLGASSSPSVYITSSIHSSLPTHGDLAHAHADTNIPNANSDATGDFLWYSPLPKNKEGVGWGWGRAAAAAAKYAAAAAAAARTRGGEINAARRSNALLACRLAVF